MDLKAKIQSKKAKVAVIGLGYVGLPLAIEYAKADFEVYGVDVSKEKVAVLKKGKTYIEDITDKDVKEVLDIGRFHPTTDFRDLSKADAVIICVPTPLRKTMDPDVSYIVAASQRIAENIKGPQLVVLESTTYPGTCDEVVRPILEDGGRAIDKDFYLAFSPERIDPGNKRFYTKTIPKVIGGVTKKSTETAHLLYSQVIETVIPVSSARVAEMVKLLENTFRSVNIGLVNEIALMCDRMGMDVWEIIDAAATKPFGFIPFYPGPGLGGHCLPIDPLYLSWKAKLYGFEARFIDLAARVNSVMPKYVMNKTAKILNTKKKCLNGSKLLVLGAAYKRDVSDVRESPAIDVIAMLEKVGAKVSYHDPYVPKIDLEGKIMHSVPLDKKALREADCVIIVTDHSSLDYEFVVDHAQLVFDTRNALKKIKKRNNIVKL
jgi:UDP-N-acetyl-D-glucosamine dehydrogenase